jgi:hypothetical protein
MRLYHVTDRDSAQGILERGFEDSEVIHDDAELQIGVWVADRCLSGEDDVGPRLGPVPDVALAVDLPAREVEPYERRDGEKPYREFCVPARILNRHDVAMMRDLEDVDVGERRSADRPLEAP